MKLCLIFEIMPLFFHILQKLHHLYVIHEIGNMQASQTVNTSQLYSEQSFHNNFSFADLTKGLDYFSLL